MAVLIILGASYIHLCIESISPTEQEVTPVGTHSVVLNDMTMDAIGRLKHVCEITRRSGEDPNRKTPSEVPEEITKYSYRHCCVCVATFFLIPPSMVAHVLVNCALDRRIMIHSHPHSARGHLARIANCLMEVQARQPFYVQVEAPNPFRSGYISTCMQLMLL